MIYTNLQGVFNGALHVVNPGCESLLNNVTEDEIY